MSRFMTGQRPGGPVLLGAGNVQGVASRMAPSIVSAVASTGWGGSGRSR